MPIKSVKMKISKNKKMRFFLMSQGSFNPKIWFLGQKVCPVASSHTDTHTDRVTTEGSLSGFQDSYLQPIIKDWPNIIDTPIERPGIMYDKGNNIYSIKCSHKKTVKSKQRNCISNMISNIIKLYCPSVWMFLPCHGQVLIDIKLSL